MSHLPHVLRVALTWATNHRDWVLLDHMPEVSDRELPAALVQALQELLAALCGIAKRNHGDGDHTGDNF